MPASSPHRLFRLNSSVEELGTSGQISAAVLLQVTLGNRVPLYCRLLLLLLYLLDGVYLSRISVDAFGADEVSQVVLYLLHKRALLEVSLHLVLLEALKNGFQIIHVFDKGIAQGDDIVQACEIFWLKVGDQNQVKRTLRTRNAIRRASPPTEITENSGLTKFARTHSSGRGWI